MEFDTTTFVLEIINFLVLVWLLQRLLYKPVTAAITARQARIAQTLADAEGVHAEATALKQQFDNRLADWEQEKVRQRQQWQQELEAERDRQMEKLAAALNDESQRRRSLDRQRLQDEQRRLATEARAEAARFVARLLSRLASPALEETIHHTLRDDLLRLSEEQRQAFHSVEIKDVATITSAYPVGDAHRSGFAQTLEALVGRPVACVFVEDPELLAGFRISLGPRMLRASLLDELNYFVEAVHVSA